MIIDLALFYNLSGTAMCILSLLMFTIRRQNEEDVNKFNAAKCYLAVMFMLSGLSMFTAQLDRGLDKNNFEILNMLMLLFFFSIAQGFLYSLLILYASRYTCRNIFNKTFLPVFLLFTVYTVAYLFIGDEPTYSAEEFMRRLPQEPMLILRCITLTAVIISVLHNIRLCHLAKKEYHSLISGYFSETDFSRSIWLSNLLASGEALSIWVFLTYFYTTPILEVIVGTLMILLFAFYVKEFYLYGKRYEQFRPALLLSMQGDTKAEDIELKVKPDEDDRVCGTLLANWTIRTDKPFTKQSLTILDVAKELNLPKYRISNYVNRNKGNFCSWINDLRIQEAARLLREETNLSISDIAEKTGFCDLPAFSRAFKKVNSISPSEYRNKVSHQEILCKL